MKAINLFMAVAFIAVLVLALNLVTDAYPMPPADQVIPPLPIPEFACAIDGSCVKGATPWK